MELLNNHVYSASYVEKWLSESAGLERGSRKWNKMLNNTGEPIVVNDDEFFFQRVSETHYRAHRANDKKAGEIRSILEEATRHGLIRNSFRRWLRDIAIVVAIAGALGIVTLVLAFILNKH
ncbi:hypothetical protein [Xanthomonas albilineans]|uniref:hypothetical protein n=1 Tax=Xanthomonas albilineans TaxID=29447 RepID=UPI0005F33EA9|nr:hypothetical protein [Xanthomonas albilineans]